MINVPKTPAEHLTEAVAHHRRHHDAMLELAAQLAREAAGDTASQPAGTGETAPDRGR
jgi:hypothetical protein